MARKKYFMINEIINELIIHLSHACTCTTSYEQCKCERFHFKLYRSFIAKKIFSKIKFVGYEHDIEIVLLSKKLKERIVELPVTWKHVKLSKVNIFADSIKMFFKVFLIKIRHQL